MTNAETRTLHVPLSDIDVPENWNARSGDWQNDVGSPDEAEGGFDGLCASIKASNGNKTPIELRPHPHPQGKLNPSGKHFMLVAGFRRYRALEKLGFNVALATVELMTETEARIANVRENVRDSLKPADLAWAIADLQRLGLSLAEGSQATGLDRSYYGRMAALVKKLRPEILTQWRTTQVAVGIRVIESVAALPEPEQPARWKLILSGANPWASREHHVKAKSRHLRGERASQCRSLGLHIAQLESIGAIAPSGVNWHALALRLFPLSNTDDLMLVAKEIEATYRSVKPK